MHTKGTIKVDRRHILFLLSSLSVGGSERKTIRIANALAEKGWKPSIAYLSGPHALRNEISDDVKVHFLNRKGKFGLGALKKLLTYVFHNKVNLICCINLYPLIYGFLVRLFLVSTPIKLVATTNETEFVHRIDVWKMLLYTPMLRRADKIIFGSTYQRNLWSQRYKLDLAESVYIHNGVDVNVFKWSDVASGSSNLRDTLGISKSGLIVGSIGRFRKEKQYEMTIQACVELRESMGINAYCLLVGGGVKEQQLKELAIQLQCQEHVVLLDSVIDVRPYLQAMDIFVLSSISETFSNAALEAMAMSKPVVLPKVGGCPEMVQEGVTGFIYDSEDRDQFTKYLFLLCSDRNLRLQMGQAARQYVETNFSFNHMIDSYIDLFQKVIEA